MSQPWSNGKVGAIGNSYTGNSALWLASTMHPAVKAVIPRHYEFDLYAETPYPGGILTDWMVKTWNEGNRQLDTYPGVRLVDEDTDQKLYQEATSRRAENIDVYASAPLETDVEITGHPVVSLFITSTHTDGAFFVYLEDIDENGKVTYVTEGELRALHRRISSERSPTKLPVPYHTFLKKDALPLKPGEVAELRFALQPISILIKKGHRLRVAIAGHDKDTFLRIPAEGTPVISMQRNSRSLSRIELPIIKR